MVGMGGGKPVRKFAMVGAAAAVATALTVGTAVPSTPPAEAAYGVFTTGPLFRALDAVGVDINDLLPEEVRAILDPLGVDIVNVPSNSVDINNAINDISFVAPPLINSRAGVVVGFGLGSFAATRAYQGLRSSAQGDTWEGYDALQPGPVVLGRQRTNTTNLVLVLLRNPSRPNGGLFARFAPVADLFGVDTVTPPGGRVPDPATGIDLNTATVDVTWAYDVLSDAPVTLNPVSWANSIAASIFLTNLLGGVEIEGDAPNDVLLNVGAILAGNLIDVTPTGGSYYLTAVPNDLALLEPMRLPVRVINAVTGWNLDTPLADAIQPAVQILVDIGYSDVVREPDGTYHRTYDTAGDPTPLLSEFPLDSPADYLRVPGDVARALVRGFRDEFLPGAPEPEDAAPETAAPLAITEAREAPETAVQKLARPVEKKPVRAELPEPTKVRTPARIAAKGVRTQVGNAAKDLRTQVDKATDDVRAAAKKAARGLTSGDRDTAEANKSKVSPKAASGD
ncbi:PE-PPE domain-containing protein [Mycolicibacterium setense]|nr:PE-PPE domain-containing protein [Mycolicibacterium setense]